MSVQKRIGLFFLALGLMLVSTAHAGAVPIKGYYRFPTLHQNTLVFSAEGDLWTVDIQGGIARRLTTHPGEETHPVISPDGRTLAFSATYEGPTEIYTMPLEGGLPTRWTYESEASIAIGFTPEGQLLSLIHI